MWVKEMKSFLRRINKFITDSEARFLFLNSLGVYNRMSDERFLKKAFKVIMKKKLNLDNPQTFNEKLQWLKLYDRKPIYTTMVDKYEVKKYVASIIGEEYVIPTLGIWERFDDIDFDALPNRFVLKCTHDSGGLAICTDKSKFDKLSAKKKLERSLQRNFYWVGREWPYKNVKPRIIAEEYMEDTGIAELRDYKFFCFGGVAKCYKVDFDRFIAHKANYFTVDGKQMKLGEKICPPDFDKTISIPANIGKMKEFAEKLSEAQPFLRTDFYDVDGKVYFGELTFYPANGFGRFIDEENDKLLGSWIKLPECAGGDDLKETYALIDKDLVCVLNIVFCSTDNGSPITGRNKSADGKHTALADYKWFCFDGKVGCLYVSDSFQHRIQFYDENYNALEIERFDYKPFEELPKKPINFDKMKELAQQLSAGKPHVRVDFYEVNGRIYFGELTLFTGAGFIPFKDEKWDRMLGSWLNLPSR